MRALALTTLISNIGGSTSYLAVAYVSYQRSRSIIITVLVATASSVPAAIVGVQAGRLADRFDRRRVILATTVAAMVIWSALAAFELAGWVTSTWLMVSGALGGTMAALRYPSWQEFVKDIVPDGRLAEANGIFSGLGSMARIVGAVVGGLAITWVGVGPVWIVNVATYVPFMVAVARVRVPRQVVRGRAAHADLRATLAYARRQPVVRLAIRLVTVVTLLAVPIAQLLPPIADELGSEAHALGLLTAFYGLGGTLVAVVLRRLGADYPRNRMVNGAVLGCGVALVVIGLSGEVFGTPAKEIGIVALLVPIGLGLNLVQAVLSAIVQVSSSAEMEGRVVALYGVAVGLVTPVGAITLGLVADGTSVWVALAVAGGLLAVIGLVVAVRGDNAVLDGAPAVHASAVDHARHLAAHSVGLVHAGHHQAVTVSTGRDAGVGASVGQQGHGLGGLDAQELGDGCVGDRAGDGVAARR